MAVGSAGFEISTKEFKREYVPVINSEGLLRCLFYGYIFKHTNKPHNM